MGNSRQPLSKQHIDALVAAASRGDTDAYERLYQEFFAKVSRFIAFRVSHRETAEDLTADVFIKAWDSIQRSAAIESFSNWLFTVARNKVIDYYRTKKATADLAELENMLPYEDSIVDEIDLSIGSRQLLAVLDQLSDDQQQLVRLKFLEDLDNEEIAAIMNKPIGTIRVIQHRAIASLKKLLSESDHA